jgi:2,4-dienoyl-CoA reductase (NADPH2)
MKDMLFEPIRINSLLLKNRIVMPAVNLNMAEGYAVTDRIIQFYAERAGGGVGLITVGFATIDELSGNPMYIGAHLDDFIPGLERLAKAIKGNGACSSVQINHAGRYNRSEHINGQQPVAPSPISSSLTRETPRELSIQDIRAIIDRFADAARRVKQAGFDAVEVLSGTGYLISEFLSPLTNKRTDRYGGSFENRTRFGIEVVQAVRETVGRDFPLIVRMNGSDFMPGGQSRQELKQYAKLLVEEGTVDALCVNVGWHEARVPQIIASVPRGAFSYLAKGIKESVEVPVIASHRINDPMTARQLIRDGVCDMVAMARSLIADPDLPNKAMEGRESEIIHCIACAQGCFDKVRSGRAVECLCNPAAGREESARITKVDTPSNVMVVGAGPAGISAALASAAKGNRVTLYEKDARLGGQLHLASAPPGREEFGELAKDLARQLLKSEVKVVAGQLVDEALIAAEKPDFVILATGATPITPPIPGVDLPHVVQAWDVLEDRVVTGRRIVIIGGGAVGVETALFLAEKGTLSGDAIKFLLVNRAEEPGALYELATRGTKDIVLVEMIGGVGKDIGRSTRWAMLQDLSRMGVKTEVQCRALEITETGVRIEKGDETGEIPCDTVVLAAGSASCAPLRFILEKRGIAYRMVGDARQIGTAFEAMHDGFNCGRDS